MNYQRMINSKQQLMQILQDFGQLYWISRSQDHVETSSLVMIDTALISSLTDHCIGLVVIPKIDCFSSSATPLSSSQTV